MRLPFSAKDFESKLYVARIMDFIENWLNNVKS